jgi:hypothetical protein
MKKSGCKMVMAGVLVLALMLAGGCCKKVGVDGTTTESFANCLSFTQDVQKFVCNPPPEVQAIVNTAEPFIVAAVAIAVPGSLAYIQAVEALGGMTAIQAGVCATVTQINALIALMSGDQAKAFQTKAMRPTFNVAPLQAWLAKGK